MGFHDVRLNDAAEVNYGTRSAPDFSVAVIENDAGQSERVARWTDPKRTFEADFRGRTHVKMYGVLEFFLARQGATHSFRFKDWNDYATTSNGTTHLPDASGSNPVVTNADQTIGTGDASETVFQITKDYTSGPTTRTRNLQKIVSGTLLVAIDGVAKAEGTDYSVNLVTGKITFNSAPGLGLDVTIGCQFDIEVHFSQETNLDTTVDNFSTRSTSIVLIEVRDQAPNPEEAFHGGSKEHGIISAASTAITLAEGRVHVFSMSAGSKAIVLPPEEDVSPGGPIFVLVNDGAFDAELQRDDAVKVVDIPTGQIVQVYQSDDGAGTLTWIASRG